PTGVPAEMGHAAGLVGEFYLKLSRSLTELGRDGEADTTLSAYRKGPPADPAVIYNMACDEARSVGSGDRGRAAAHLDHAMTWLRLAVRSGWTDREQIRRDPDLDPLRGRDDFRLLMMDLAMPADPFAVAR